MATRNGTSNNAVFDQGLLADLDKWIRSKGGKVQARLVGDFYHKNPKHRGQLQSDRLYMLADCADSKVHLVGGPAGNNLEFLELKQLGSKPLRRPEPMKDADGVGAQSNANTDSASLALKTTSVVATSASLSSALPKFISMPEGYDYALVRDPVLVRNYLRQYNPDEPYAFDFKGDVRRDGRFAIVQISNVHEQVLIIDLVDNATMPDESGLKAFFQDPTKSKVFLDCARTTEAIRALWGVETSNVFDLSRASLVLRHAGPPSPTEPGASLIELIKDHGISFHRVPKPDETWFRRPMSIAQIEYACRGVMHNAVIYQRIAEKAKELDVMGICVAESQRYSKASDAILELRDSNDWTCGTCGFENFARRYSCKKCNSTHKIPKRNNGPPSGPRPAQAARPSPPSTNGSGNNDQQLSRDEQLLRIEEEALRLAMELSLQDEKERVERARRSQLVELDRQKEESTRRLRQEQERRQREQEEKLQRKHIEQQQQQQRQISASTTTASKASITPLPRLAGDPFSNGPSLMSLDQPFNPGTAFPHMMYDPSSSFTAQQQSPLYSDFGYVGGGGSMDAESASAIPWVNTLSFLDPQQQDDMASYQFVPPSPTLPPQMSASLQASGASRVVTPRSVSLQFPSFSPTETNPGNEPRPLDEDEQLLLTMDATSLVQELGFDTYWVNIVATCASQSGARVELIEAPLPVFAKSLENNGMTLPQRAAVLKHLHARKNATKG